MGTASASAVQIRTFGSVTHALYMEPSDFGYVGLTEQREGGENSYDNFLRSNIDNQQDERDFQTEAGRDHLPFRSFEAATTDISDTVEHKIPTPAGTPGPAIFVDPGEPYIIPCDLLIFRSVFSRLKSIFANSVSRVLVLVSVRLK